MIRGSCLCRAVQFQIEGPVGPASHCHCTMCQKAHGAACGSYAIVKSADFRLLSGEKQIRRYESSRGVVRTFCGTCGSTLQWLRLSNPGQMDIALGVLDGDPGVRPSKHIYVASKAPWVDITDQLPQHAEGGPS
jgi:hypothetical protein